MDPLSLTASVVAIIGLTGKVGTGLDKLYSLRNAPDEVLALLNEISDFKAVLLNLKDIIDGLQVDHNTSHHRQQREALQSCASQLMMYIQRAKDQLLGLEKVIEYRIVTLPGAEDKKPSINRRRFVRAGQDIQRFQRGLNELKGKIHLTISTLSTSQVSQVRLELLSIEAMVSQVRDQQREMTAMNTSILRDIQQAVAQRDVVSHEHQQAPLQDSARTEESTPLTYDTPENSQSEMLCQRQTQSTVSSTYTKLDVLQINTIHTSRLACHAWCSCACHRRGGLQTPSFLQKIVGSLYVGYVGGLVLTTKCDEPRCSRPSQRSAHITYYFPMWFISRTIAATISGPRITCTALRKRASSDPVFSFAERNNWKEISALFDEGRASVLDVDENGWSTLHWAVIYGSSETCKVLLMLGADPDVENNSLMTPREYAVSRYLGQHDTLEDSMCQAFGFGHSIEEFLFTRLHKLILNLVPGDLEAELQYLTTSINSQDNKGATALRWAAYRGDSALVQLLLKHDADPNIADVVGTTPLYFVFFLSYECIIDLINHGADSNVADIRGVTPFHNASRYCPDPRFVDCLVANGANVNFLDRNGSSALHYAVEAEKPAVVTRLLGYGAEINTQIVFGSTPLSIAIENNSSQCLKILLEAGADCTCVLKDQGSVLHTAAAYAFVETLQILTSFKISGIDCDLRDNCGRTPWNVFWERRDEYHGGTPPALVNAFKELHDTIRQENLKLASSNPDAGSDPQNDNYADGSIGDTATSDPPVPGAWNIEE